MWKWEIEERWQCAALRRCPPPFRVLSPLGQHMQQAQGCAAHAHMSGSPGCHLLFSGACCSGCFTATRVKEVRRRKECLASKEAACLAKRNGQISDKAPASCNHGNTVKSPPQDEDGMERLSTARNGNGLLYGSTASKEILTLPRSMDGHLCVSFQFINLVFARFHHGQFGFGECLQSSPVLLVFSTAIPDLTTCLTR